MKRTEFLAVVLVAGAFTLGCSSDNGTAANGTGGNATGGTSASSQSAAGSGGTQQTGGNLASGGVSSAAGGNRLGGTIGSGGSELGGTIAAGGTTSAGGSGLGGTSAAGGTTSSGGSGLGGATSTGGATRTGGSGVGGTGSGGSGQGGSTTGSGGTSNSGGTSSSGGKSTGSGGTVNSGGTSSSGGVVTTGGSSSTGGVGGKGGASATGGSTGSSGCVSVAVGTLTDPGPGATDPSPPNPPGITFKDTDGDLVNAHGGGIIQVCDTFYLHGEYFLSSSTENLFNGFSMYSSKDLVTWKKEGNKGIILPQQGSTTELAPGRKGERPHIIKCPATGEFVLYAHAADSTYQVDKEVVYATSNTVNAVYSYKGALTNAAGTKAEHSDMGAFADGNDAYVVTESGHIYKLATDCHSWLSDNSYGAMGGMESPAVFKANGTYYWIMSNKTGWRANDDEYASAPSMTGPWTNQGLIAPAGKKTWMTQSTWVLPIVGSQGTTYMYWGDHWYGNQDATAQGDHNYLATYVFQPIVFNGTKISLPTYQASWKIDIGAGTWSSQ